MRIRAEPRGFTLVEVTVALVLLGVVALLVYGAAGVGMDVEHRLRVEHERRQSQAALRVLMTDALRNARPPRRGEAASFRLQDRTGPDGVPRDRVSFLAAGSAPPLSWAYDWRVRFESTAEGLEVWTRPRGVRSDWRRIGRLEEVTGLEVSVVERETNQAWASTWDYRSMVPRAVQIRFWKDTGPAGMPLVVALPRGRR